MLKTIILLFCLCLNILFFASDSDIKSNQEIAFLQRVPAVISMKEYLAQSVQSGCLTRSEANEIEKKEKDKRLEMKDKEHKELKPRSKRKKNKIKGSTEKEFAQGVIFKND